LRRTESKGASLTVFASVQQMRARWLGGSTPKGRFLIARGVFLSPCIGWSWATHAKRENFDGIPVAMRTADSSLKRKSTGKRNRARNGDV
jgi:hypothetical protein